MALLKDAVAEIVDELQTISDLRNVPDEPPTNADPFPFAVVYPLSGIFVGGPAPLMKGLHSINIEIHVALKDMPRDFRHVMKLIDQIPYEMMKLRKDGLLTNLSTFGGISYTFGELSWAGVKTLGVIYTLEDVKIEREIT